MIEIPNKTVDYCIELVSRYKGMLNGQKPIDNAVLTYHPQADALVWSDELPLETDFTFKQFFMIALQVRTSEIIGSIGDGGNRILDHIRVTCPQWAFCQPERFNRSLGSEFHKMRDEFSKVTDQLAEDFEKWRASRQN